MAPRKGSRPRPLTQPEIDRILELYASGTRIHRIAEALGRSTAGVRKFLMRRGLFKPSAGRRWRKLQPREDAFDSAEASEEAAYWVGFLLADGCVHSTTGRRQPVISLDLKASDRGHVEALAAFLGLPQEVVRPGHQGRSAALSIRSSRLADALARYGVVPRKSLTAEPKLLTGSRHFWRGVVDGDGCLHITRVRKKYETGRRAVLQFTGSEKVTAAFAVFAASVAAGCEAVPKQVGNHWIWTTSGSYAVRLVRELYAGCSVALPRKLALAHEILALGESGYQTTEREDSPQGRSPRGRRFLTHNGETKPLAEWAAQFGLPVITLQARLRYGWEVADAITRPVTAGRAKMLTCTRPGCDRPHVALGLCRLHYKRRRRGCAD